MSRLIGQKNSRGALLQSLLCNICSHSSASSSSYSLVSVKGLRKFGSVFEGCACVPEGENQDARGKDVVHGATVLICEKTQSMQQVVCWCGVNMHAREIFPHNTHRRMWWPHRLKQWVEWCLLGAAIHHRLCVPIL